MARQLSSRERALLVILAVAALGTVWYMMNGADASRVAGGPADGEAGNVLGAAPEVDMALLTREAERYDPDGRDLFKYAQRPPTAEELAAAARRREADQKRQEQLQEQAEKARESQAARVVQPVDTGPRPPRVNFRYLGYLGPKDERIAVFEQKDELLLARIGESFQDQFRVVDIQYESVVVGFTDPRFQDRTETLDMAGK